MLLFAETKSFEWNDIAFIFTLQRQCSCLRRIRFNFGKKTRHCQSIWMSNRTKIVHANSGAQPDAESFDYECNTVLFQYINSRNASQWKHFGSYAKYLLVQENHKMNIEEGEGWAKLLPKDFHSFFNALSLSPSVCVWVCPVLLLRLLPPLPKCCSPNGKLIE